MSRSEPGVSTHDPRDEQRDPALAVAAERVERSEIRRYLARLMLVLFIAASIMVAVGLFAYRQFQGERAETTRRVPVTRQVSPGGSVHYVPVDEVPRQ